MYVDNILCIGNQRAINSQKVDLAKYFVVKDEGKMEEYMGCLVMRNAVGNIVLHQPHLIKKIQLEFRDKLINVCTPIMSDGPGSLVVRMTDNEKLKGRFPKEQQTQYCSGVGMLLYLVKFSRPDILNSVRKLTKAMDCANKTLHAADPCVEIRAVDKQPGHQI